MHRLKWVLLGVFAIVGGLFAWRVRQVAAGRLAQRDILSDPITQPPTLSGLPDVVDRTKLKITLVRTSCMGSCPDYGVSISGDGLVKYFGTRQVLVEGEHIWRISPEAVTALLDDFRSANFFAARPLYSHGGTDLPTFEVTLRYEGRAKTVEDYWGSSVGMPAAITKLEDQIDELAGTARWVHGDAGTLPALDEEHWNFSAVTPANVALYDHAIEQGNDGLLQRFLEVRMNPVTAFERVAAPACVASGLGDAELLAKMLKGMPRADPAVAAACLREALPKGNLTLTLFWLSHGANAAAPGLLYLAASMSPNPSQKGIVEALLRAGANANDHSPIGWNPLYMVQQPETAAVLIAAGANVKERDQAGATPLSMHAYDEALVRLLLAAGADPDSRSTNGDTPLSVAKQFRCKPCVAMLEDAIRTRATAAR